ncbi:serine/threonine protein kinase [Aquabacterium sp.]|uniref:serine/threonine protein kinase n=1 Tax=Aquabacterium sp. TaxID=1872578 RepID=UPI003D6CC880
MHSPDTPYANLTPDAVLHALQAVGVFSDGRLLQLNSYENRVFQIGLEDAGYVIAKFYRAGRWTDEQILEEHAFAQELLDAEVPAVAPLPLIADLEVDPAVRCIGQPATLGLLGDIRVAVTPRKGGRSPELEDPEVLERLGRFLARLHTVGAARQFKHRTTMSVQTTGRAARDWLVEHEVVTDDQRAVWLSVADQALDLAQAAFDRIDGLCLRRLHGDCHVGNVLWTPEGPHFVDLDDACMGPAVQDLWMLLSGDHRERQQQLHSLLQGYESFADFDWRELALIEPLRTLRIIHHSAWLARRWADPAFPAAFAWFGTSAYWSEQSQLLRQQIELMQDGGQSRSMDDDDNW